MRTLGIVTGIVALTATVLAAVPAAAQVNFQATPLVQSSTTLVGVPIAYPDTDKPEITALLIEIGPGGESGRHMHPNPTFVYVLEGSLDVEMEGKGHSFKAGDAFLEVVDTWHNGKNNGTTPAKILVVFSGAAGKPNLVRPE
jgi:quercetin dioxygenase-like cupin family protein